MNNSINCEVKTSSRSIAKLTKFSHSKVMSVIEQASKDSDIGLVETHYWTCQQNKQRYRQLLISSKYVEVIVAILNSKKKTKTNYRKKKISKQKRQKVLEKYNYQCGNCLTTKDLCIDHKTPEVRGGTNDFENLQILCRSCNSRKGVKTMNEWLGVDK